MRIICLLSVVIAVSASAIPPEPAQPQKGPIALVGGTAHIGDGNVVENALVTFAGGKITSVTTFGGDVPDGHVPIDIRGQHVYPGFIAVSNNVGLVEVNSIRASSDQTERGDLNPNVRTIVSYNTDSELTPTLRFAGVLMAQVAPRGQLVAGRSSIVQLDAWNWEDAAYVTDDGLHVTWPNRRTVKPIEGTRRVEYVSNENYQKSVGALTALFESASVYASDPDAGVNLKLESMSGLFDGSTRLYITVHAGRDIVSAVRFARRFGIQHVVVVGGRGAEQVAGFLVEENVPVVLGSVHRLPSLNQQPIDYPYRLPSILSEAGVLVGLTQQSNINGRNLPFDAGTAAAYGLGKEQALTLITLNNAKILGIDDRVGSLEAGKDATLFVSRGDALDMRGNDLSIAFIGGREITLPGMQQELYERFRRKYAAD